MLILQIGEANTSSITLTRKVRKPGDKVVVVFLGQNGEIATRLSCRFGPQRIKSRRSLGDFRGKTGLSDLPAAVSTSWYEACVNVTQEMLHDIIMMGAWPIPGTTENRGSAVQVWLVDDDKAVRGLLKEALESPGRLECPLEFGNPTAVLGALQTQSAPDVILLDVHMGLANGLDAVAPIRRLAPNTRILMLTTFFDPQSEPQALKNGAMGFLLKRYAPELILQRIFEALEEPLPKLTSERAEPWPRPATDEKWAAASAVPPTRAGHSGVHKLLDLLRGLTSGAQARAD